MSGLPRRGLASAPGRHYDATMSPSPARRRRRTFGGHARRRLLGVAALFGAAGLGALGTSPGGTAAPSRAGQPAPRPAFAPPAAEALLAGEVDQARMQATVRQLVRIGPRMGGTPSGDRAAAAIAAALAGAGLTPETIEDPPRPVHWEDSWSVELMPGGRLASAYPYGFSPSIGPGAAPLAVAA